MLLLQGCFLLEVCVTKQCPPLMSDNAGIISSVSPPPFILSKSLIQAAKGVIFHFQERELLLKRLWTGVCPCVLSLRSHQARVTVIRSAPYWCVHVCVACIPSQWGPVNMWGGHGLIKCAEEKNSMPFVLQKQRWLWIHYVMVACQGVRWGRVARK